MRWPILQKEQIQQAIDDAGLERVHSCCGAPLKWCDADLWRGDLEGFASAIVRHTTAPIAVSEQLPPQADNEDLGASAMVLCWHTWEQAWVPGRYVYDEEQWFTLVGVVPKAVVTYWLPLPPAPDASGK